MSRSRWETGSRYLLSEGIQLLGLETFVGLRDDNILGVLYEVQLAEEVRA